MPATYSEVSLASTASRKFRHQKCVLWDASLRSDAKILVKAHLKRACSSAAQCSSEEEEADGSSEGDVSALEDESEDEGSSQQLQWTRRRVLCNMHLLGRREAASSLMKGVVWVTRKEEDPILKLASTLCRCPEAFAESTHNSWQLDEQVRTAVQDGRIAQGVVVGQIHDQNHPVKRHAAPGDVVYGMFSTLQAAAPRILGVYT
eukprot:gene28813-35780_t